MNYRSSGRTKRKGDDDSLRFGGGYKLGKAVASEALEASVYEVDVSSPANFCSELPAVKVCLASVAPMALEKKSATRNGAFKIVENPLIESHYPRFLETDSESERKLPVAEKADFITQTSLPSVVRDSSAGELSREHSPVEKPEDCPSPSPDSLYKLKKQLKKQVFKDLLAKNDSIMSECTSNAVAASEKDQLHVHHHEHHHHYHFEKKSPRPGDDSSVGASKPTSSDSQETTVVAPKRYTVKKKSIAENSPRHTYYYTCDSKSNATFTKVVLSTDTDDLQDSDRPIRTYRSSRTSRASRLRPSSSIESIPNNKSYLIETHTYSDTELVKCDSDELVHCEVFTQSPPNNNSPSFIATLKCLNHCPPELPPPAHQKPDPPTQPSPDALSPAAHLGPEPAPEAPPAEDGAPRKQETAPRKDSDVPPLVVKRNTNGRLDTMPLQVWAEKIKTELKEIKRELRTIEREFLKKKSSMCMELNDSKSKSEEESGHEISVFSSRTFILRAENFYIIEESDSGPLSEDIESFMENEELCYAETDAGRFLPEGSLPAALPDPSAESPCP